MSDEQWVDRLKLLNEAEISDLYDALGEYSVVMPDGPSPNEIEANIILKSILVILAGGRA